MVCLPGSGKSERNSGELNAGRGRIRRNDNGTPSQVSENTRSQSGPISGGEGELRNKRGQKFYYVTRNAWGWTNERRDVSRSVLKHNFSRLGGVEKRGPNGDGLSRIPEDGKTKKNPRTKS